MSDQVIARCFPALRHMVGQKRVHFIVCGDGYCGLSKAYVELTNPPSKPLTFVLGQAKHMSYHACRYILRVIDGRVEFSPAGKTFKRLAANRMCSRLECLDGSRREERQQ